MLWDACRMLVLPFNITLIRSCSICGICRPYVKFHFALCVNFYFPIIVLLMQLCFGICNENSICSPLSATEHFLQSWNNGYFSGLAVSSGCWRAVSQNVSSMESMLQMLDFVVDQRNNSSIYWRQHCNILLLITSTRKLSLKLKVSGKMLSNKGLENLNQRRWKKWKKERSCKSHISTWVWKFHTWVPLSLTEKNKIK